MCTRGPESFSSGPEFELSNSQCLRYIYSTTTLDGLSLATLHGAYTGSRADVALLSERDEIEVLMAEGDMEGGKCRFSI